MRINSGVKYKIALLWIFIGFMVRMVSQDDFKGAKIYFSPRITLGYTISSGFNYGFDIVAGLYQFKKVNFGLDFTYYMVNTDQGRHGIKGFQVVADMEYLNIKLGAGAVSRRWGLKNVNKAKAPGILIDVSAGIDPYKAPWIGVKGFVFNRGRWTFYDQPSYISAYTYFKTEEIEVYKEEQPSQGQ
ncbi:MAG: hypothetical protein U0W24_01960 [Bacteroidales bacterium]